MAEYIEREAAINLFYPVDQENDGSDGGTIICKSGNYTSAEIESMLCDLPAADVAPVLRVDGVKIGELAPVRSGHWIEDEYGYSHCSECGYEWDEPETDSPFCPNCGSRNKEGTMKYCFGDIVIVDGNQIGVIVKSWEASLQGLPESHDVYVRSYNRIFNYPESEIRRYMVRHKYLDEQEMEWQANAKTEGGTP